MISRVMSFVKAPSAGLAGELAGLWSARRGDYRIVYEILRSEQMVVVHRVQHRGTVYRPK